MTGSGALTPADQVQPGGWRTDRGYARELDASDPLASYRDVFELPRRPDGSALVYLCGNSLGLMPSAARAAVDGELDDWARLGVDGHFRATKPWYSYHALCRETGARLVGAIPGEVVMMNSLTVNLHLLLVSFYRPAGRRHKILIEDGAFPSDRYAVAAQAAYHGFDPAEAVLVVRPRRGEAVLRTEDIIGLLNDRGGEIAVVLLAGVQYLTGQVLDMARITVAARGHGCVVGFDLAHAAGNVPLALHEWGVDFAVWCSYKYLNGGPGAVAGCFIHHNHAHRPELPRFAGWWGNDPDTRFRMADRFAPQPGAEGWQVSNPPILSFAPVVVSLGLFDRVGMEALRRKSVRLTAYLERLLRGVGTDRLEILTPSDPASRGCQLSLRVPRAASRVHEALSTRGIVTDLREPNVLRASPVPFYNTYGDVWTFAEALRNVVGADSLPA